MDSLRRVFSGTLAELLGAGALASDVQLRTLGLRRGGEESLPKYPAATVAWLQAYADGVNAYVKANPLPPEYGAIQLTKASAPDWTPLDSLTVAKGLAFQLSFDPGDIDRTVALAAFVAAGQGKGFDPVAAYFDDVNRDAPFDPTISIPGWLKATRADAAPAALPGSLALPALAGLPALPGDTAAGRRPSIRRLRRWPPFTGSQGRRL